MEKGEGTHEQIMPSGSLPHTPRNKNRTNPLLLSKHVLSWPLADGSVIPPKSLWLSALLPPLLTAKSSARGREELRKKSLAGGNLTTEG